jgi:hypothetical protein
MVPAVREHGTGLPARAMTRRHFLVAVFHIVSLFVLHLMTRLVMPMSISISISVSVVVAMVVVLVVHGPVMLLVFTVARGWWRNGTFSGDCRRQVLDCDVRFGGRSRLLSIR